jgi:hypothetical protein
MAVTGLGNKIISNLICLVLSKTITTLTVMFIDVKTLY